MIAVIEPGAQVVWGFGPTPAAAMQDAQREISEYTGPEKVGPLEYAKLKAGADLETDGAALWRWVEQDQEQALQAELF